MKPPERIAGIKNLVGGLLRNRSLRFPFKIASSSVISEDLTGTFWTIAERKPGNSNVTV